MCKHIVVFVPNSMMVIVFLLLLMSVLSLVVLLFSEFCDEHVTIFQYHCHLLTEMNYFVYVNALYLVINAEFFVSLFPVVSCQC
jgi:hypothetical protein